MVKKGDLALYGGLGILAVGAYLALGGAKGIGSRIGKGVSDFGNSIIGGISDIGKGFSDGVTTTSAEQVVGTLDLGGNVTNVPTPFDQTFSSKRDNTITRELLAVSGILKDTGSTNKIDVRGRQLEIRNQFGSAVQPLDFAFDNDGIIRTGSSGLSPAVLKKQAELSAKFGIITFDESGAVSTIGGLASGV